MRVIDCIEAYSVLGRLPLAGLDKAVRDTLMDDHFALWRVSREFDEYMESLRGSDGADEARRRYLWREVEIELGKVGRESVAKAAADAMLTIADMTKLGFLIKKED